MKSLLLLLTLTACPADWSKKDTALESVALTMTTTDLFQTHNITDNCTESNPIIGDCGQRVDYRLYFLSVTVIEVVVSRLLPANSRSVFMGAWGGAEAATVWDNYRGATR